MDASPPLLDLLSQVPDPRRAEGKRHPLPVVQSLLVLAVALLIPIRKRSTLAGDRGSDLYGQCNGLIARLRNSTGSLWPARPKKPEARSSPGWAELAMKFLTVLRSVSRITVPLSSTLTFEPFTVTSWKFQRPTGRW